MAHPSSRSQRLASRSFDRPASDLRSAARSVCEWPSGPGLEPVDQRPLDAAAGAPNASLIVSATVGGMDEPRSSPLNIRVSAA
jgi:hypothetical protein